MKKRIGSVLLALALCLSLLPATALAADAGGTGTSVNVETEEEFKNALNNNDATEIHITGDIRYFDSLNSSKTIYIDNGATLTLSAYNATVSGTIVNDGTVKVTSEKCFWKAQTTGSGTLIGREKFSSPTTYVDYGCVSDTVTLQTCLVNIVADTTQTPVASLPTSMKTGDTIQVTVSNLIDGVNANDVFEFTWKDGSSNQMYNNATTPTLTKAGKLKLTLQPKTGYIMLTSSGYEGSLDVEGTVEQETMTTVYVDSTNGNNSNLGNTQTAPLRSIRDAMDKVSENGTIVLLSNYSSYIVFNKSVTVKSKDGSNLTLTSSYPNYVSDGVTVTFENLNFANANFRRTYNSAQGTGSLVFQNCTGSLSIGSGDISNITMENSQLSGNISASELLTMNSSTFSDQFNTKNFSADGDCTINCKKNAPSRISDTVSAETPVKLVPFADAEAGAKLLEFPKDSNSTVASSFALDDTTGAYGIVYSKQYNADYLCLAQRISSADVKIAVGYEPKNKLVPNNPAYVASTGTGIATCDATWSKDTAWSVGDKPKLTVTLKASDGYIFDNNFNVSGLLVYSRTDMTTYPSYEDAAKNTSVACSTEQGQGVGEDGKTYTFTVQYPAIERSTQTIRVDTTDRTANCGDTLDPRSVSAQGKISYDSNNKTVATVDSNGVVKALKAGETTITIRAAQTADYQAATTSYKLTVSHKYTGDWKKMIPVTTKNASAVIRAMQR